MMPDTNAERRLLFLSFLWVWAALALVYVNRNLGADLTLPVRVALTHCLVFAGLYVLLKSSAPGHDPILLPLVSLLTGLGLVLIYDVKPALVGKQSNWLLVSAVALWMTTWTREVRNLGRYKYTFMFLGVALLLATTLLGNPLGSRGDIKLALQIGPVNVQPSELARLFLIIFLAAFLSEKRDLMVFGRRAWWQLGRQDLRYLGPMVVMWGISLLFLIYSRDLGAALLFFGIFMAMLYMADTRAIYLVLGTVLFCGGAYFCYQTFGHVQDRIDIWLNPWQDVENKGYQIVQSLFALGGGGLLGTGLGQGYSFKVPAVHTDLIFSAAAEELGLAGSIAILALFLLCVYRGFHIALRARDDMSMLTAAGLSFALGLQTCIIIGGATKMIPLTGITLPFISYGGSSLVSNSILVGLLIVASRNRQS